MYIFTRPAESFDEKNIHKLMIIDLIQKHSSLVVGDLKRKMDYYLGNHAILGRKKPYKDQPNNKVVVNHAKNISDTATGYFLSYPITYNSKGEKNEAVDKLTDAFVNGDTDETDHDNALDLSRCGVAYEYVYIKEGTNIIKTRNLSPLSTFKVYDTTIEQNELFSVYYSIEKDDHTNLYNIIATVTSQNYVTRIGVEVTDLKMSNPKYRLLEEPYPHFLGEDPIIEYRNNKDYIGDYEQQISLIDAYNTLTSDRINDKEQFLNAILLIYGALLGDDGDETSKAVKAIKELGVMELPEGSKAEYLSRTFDEEAINTLRNAVKDDIYTMSQVPNLTDEKFSGNTSGVAMQYKLLGLEMLTKTKERYYRKSLKKRIRLFCNYLNLTAINADPSLIEAVFSRGLPQNRLELSQIINNLKGTVSLRTLLSQLDFVDNVDDELEALKEEKEEVVEQQQEMFSGEQNESLSDENNKSGTINQKEEKNEGEGEK